MSHFSDRQAKLCLTMVLALVMPLGNVFAQGEKVTYDEHVKPIFQQRCANCHNGGKQSGGLDVTNYTNLMQGGGSGQSVEPGDAGSSYLYLLVNHDETPVMPPGGSKLPEKDISTIEAWIDGGAVENRGSVAMVRKKVAAVASVNVGVRPAHVAYPQRMSLQPTFVAEGKGVVRAVSVSPWAPIAALGGTKQILLYDLNTRTMLGVLPFESGRPNVLKFSRNGALLMAAGGRQGLVGKVQIWDTETTQQVTELGEETDAILAADLSADHSLVTIGGPQKMVRVYSTQSSELIFEKKKHTDWITALEFSPDGVLLASADRNGGVVIWEAETGNEYLQIAGHSDSVTDMAWRPDANVLATSSDDGMVKLWAMENGKQIKSWTAHGNGVNGVEFSRDSQLFTVGRDTAVKLWKQDGKLVRQFDGLGEFGVSVEYCDETKRVIASDFSGAVVLFDSDKAKKIGVLESNPLPLNDRLQKALSRQSELVKKIKPVKNTWESLQQKLSQLEERLAASIETRDREMKKMEELHVALSKTSERIQSSQNERDKWRRELTNAQTALPAVQNAAEGAREAAEALSIDGELKDLADKMHAKLVQLQKKVSDLDQRINQSISSDNLLQSNLSETQSQLDGHSNNLKVANTKIKEIRESQIGPASKRLSEAKANLEQLEQVFAKVQAEIEFLRSEIEFDQKMALIQKDLQAAQTVLMEKEAEVQGAETALEKAQNILDAKMSSRDQSQEKVRLHEAELRKLRIRK